MNYTLDVKTAKERELIERRDMRRIKRSFINDKNIHGKAFWLEFIEVAKEHKRALTNEEFKALYDKHRRVSK